MTKDQPRITIKKCPRPCGKYVIKIEGRVVWEGNNPHEKLPAMIIKNPGKSLSISWKRQREFLIV